MCNSLTLAATLKVAQDEAPTAGAKKPKASTARAEEPKASTAKAEELNALIRRANGPLMILRRQFGDKETRNQIINRFMQPLHGEMQDVFTKEDQGISDFKWFDVFTATRNQIPVLRETCTPGGGRITEEDEALLLQLFPENFTGDWLPEETTGVMDDPTLHAEMLQGVKNIWDNMMYYCLCTHDGVFDVMNAIKKGDRLPIEAKTDKEIEEQRKMAVTLFEKQLYPALKRDPSFMAMSKDLSEARYHAAEEEAKNETAQLNKMSDEHKRQAKVDRRTGQLMQNARESRRKQGDILRKASPSKSNPSQGAAAKKLKGPQSAPKQKSGSQLETQRTRDLRRQEKELLEADATRKRKQQNDTLEAKLNRMKAEAALPLQAEAAPVTTNRVRVEGTVSHVQPAEAAPAVLPATAPAVLPATATASVAPATAAESVAPATAAGAPRTVPQTLPCLPDDGAALPCKQRSFAAADGDFDLDNATDKANAAHLKDLDDLQKQLKSGLEAYDAYFARIFTGYAEKNLHGANMDAVQLPRRARIGLEGNANEPAVLLAFRINEGGRYEGTFVPWAVYFPCNGPTAYGVKGQIAQLIDVGTGRPVPHGANLATLAWKAMHNLPNHQGSYEVYPELMSDAFAAEHPTQQVLLPLVPCAVGSLTSLAPAMTNTVDRQRNRPSRAPRPVVDMRFVFAVDYHLQKALSIGDDCCMSGHWAPWDAMFLFALSCYVNPMTHEKREGLPLYAICADYLKGGQKGVCSNPTCLTTVRPTDHPFAHVRSIALMVSHMEDSPGSFTIRFNAHPQSQYCRDCAPLCVQSDYSFDALPTPSKVVVATNGGSCEITPLDVLNACGRFAPEWSEALHNAIILQSSTLLGQDRTRVNSHAYGMGQAQKAVESYEKVAAAQQQQSEAVAAAEAVVEIGEAVVAAAAVQQQQQCPVRKSPISQRSDDSMYQTIAEAACNGDLADQQSSQPLPAAAAAEGPMNFEDVDPILDEEQMRQLRQMQQGTATATQQDSAATANGTGGANKRKRDMSLDSDESEEPLGSPP